MHPTSRAHLNIGLRPLSTTALPSLYLQGPVPNVTFSAVYQPGTVTRLGPNLSEAGAGSPLPSLL